MLLKGLISIIKMADKIGVTPGSVKGPPWQGPWPGSTEQLQFWKEKNGLAREGIGIFIPQGGRGA